MLKYSKLNKKWEDPNAAVSKCWIGFFYEREDNVNFREET